MSVPKTQIEKPFFTERGPTLILLFESYLVLATALLLLVSYPRLPLPTWTYTTCNRCPTTPIRYYLYYRVPYTPKVCDIL